MTAQRDHRIDLFRGMALVWLFWDHVPDNLLGHLTLRNVGLSDAAELFVFLAGYGAMLAYGGLYEREGYYPMALRVLRRSWILYVAHVFILAQLMGVVFVANAHVDTRDFVAEAGLNYFIEQPQRALIAGLLLSFKPMLMDPLPLYIVLLVVAALVLPTLVRNPLRVMVPSLLVYALAQVLGVNLPSRPDGVWFFNPLTWQMLFLLGAFLARPALTGQAPVLSQAVQRRLLAPALVFLALSAMLAWLWRVPTLHDAIVPQWLARAIYPISKTDLDPLRLLHFLAVVLCVSWFVRPGAWLSRPLPAALRLMGRHSLEVFCFGVLLAPLADAINARADERLSVQLTTGFGGAVLMWALAWTIEEYRRVSAGRPKQAPEAVPSDSSVTQ